METLPEDIIWIYFIKKLKAYDLLFVCKYIYYCYLTKIKENELISKRYNRIQEGYDEFLRTQNLIVKLDRMCLVDFKDEHCLVIYGKLFHNESIDTNNITISVIYTCDKWSSTRNYAITPIKQTSNGSHFSIKFTLSSAAYKPHLHNVWFAIEASHKEYVIYDNNNGWNYACLQQYNWIPSIHLRECTHCSIFCDECCRRISLQQWCLTEPELLILEN